MQDQETPENTVAPERTVVHSNTVTLSIDESLTPNGPLHCSISYLPLLQGQLWDTGELVLQSKQGKTIRIVFQVNWDGDPFPLFEMAHVAAHYSGDGWFAFAVKLERGDQQRNCACRSRLLELREMFSVVEPRPLTEPLDTSQEEAEARYDELVNFNAPISYRQIVW